MYRAFLGLCLLALFPIAAQAVPVTFTITPSQFGNPLAFSTTTSSGPVNFTVSLSASSSANLISDANGLGVFGGTNNIDATETITFATPTVTSVSGGTVTFNNFTGVNVVGLQTGDAGTVGGPNFTSDGLVSVGGSTFTVTGVTNALAPNQGFQVASVIADFTVTPSAVPEPSSLALCGLIGAIGVFRRRRRV